jgi:2-keto-4-pentenoate hydratase
MDIEAAAQAVVRGWDEGRHMPSEWAGRLSLEEAYAVQLRLLGHLVAKGERQAGWKVALTSAAARAQFNAGEPGFGFLLASGERASGHVFRMKELQAPGFENELCLFVSKRLQGPGVDLAQVLGAVSHVAPALEIVERRGPPGSDLPLMFADNAMQKAFVLGPKTALDGANANLAAASVSVFLNGALCETASAAEVMGQGPMHSVLWLANKLAEFDLAIEAGSAIMAGSLTRLYPLSPGDLVESRFAPFGTVTASLAAIL